MDLIKELTQNKFLLILLPVEKNSMKIVDILKCVEKTHSKICYVCLSKPYLDVKEELNQGKIDIERFFFIDVLTSHYKEPEVLDNCVFLEGPTNLTALMIAASKVVKEKACNAIVFDDISELLMFKEPHSIVRFTHDLLLDKDQKECKKVFFTLKEDTFPEEEYERLIKDLSMFADKILDLDST